MSDAFWQMRTVRYQSRGIGWPERTGIAIEDLVSRHGAEAGAMERTLARLNAGFGGPIGYLRGIGMEDATMERLRARLLE